MTKEGCLEVIGFIFILMSFFHLTLKPLSHLHIHFFDENGEIRVYLSQEKYLEIDEKWGIVPKHKRTKIINKTF
ncbi:hypothetical protein [endosymbiont GvMRE of Glomus versiforme]|uniref:hypothetical protein n=1 Tax=endosymbiont GvMRE of Glomus versiforme TaxID=2039283 RepID=UPI0011C3647E|nr:hypothetical protein [endosymbiont GvMRE of Glomus versiforme]